MEPNEPMWERGEEVRLKSGGPVMVVVCVVAGRALCAWQVGEDIATASVSSGSFDVRTLDDAVGE